MQIGAAAVPGGGGQWPPLSLLKLVIKRWPLSAVPYISCFLPPPPSDNHGSVAVVLDLCDQTSQSDGCLLLWVA